MTIKTVLYLIVVPSVIWAFEAVNINCIFKKNRVYQARICYLFLLFATSYLVVNFFYDFYAYSKFV